MTRRYPDMRYPRHHWTDGEVIGTVIAGMVGTIIFAGMMWVAASLMTATPAKSDDSWINRGQYKNSAGEWCCGDYDCKAYKETQSTATGWLLDGELVPYDEAMPIAPPDGQVTVCRRPDGTRRCVFGLKPGL